MPTKEGWTTAYLTKKTKQRFYELRLVGERIEDTFERVAKTTELLKSKSLPDEDIFETGKRLVSTDEFCDRIMSLVRPVQLPNETILDTIKRLLEVRVVKDSGDPLTKTRTVI